jgi:hypothetical protein
LTKRTNGNSYSNIVGSSLHQKHITGLSNCPTFLVLTCYSKLDAERQKLRHVCSLFYHTSRYLCLKGHTVAEIICELNYKYIPLIITSMYLKVAHVLVPLSYCIGQVFITSLLSMHRNTMLFCVFARKTSVPGSTYCSSSKLLCSYS